ncbi:GNAT family N-acetyltransferase [Shewanella sp. AS16]|uniref:GNAT family N-acetyltransferase n=1 Tax=Shewanella sp. AS16 TaxID=2907625 RepID=UPI001F1D9BCF|nr:GNAT family protein [Shewanella sp. AS16]MCE9684816.1 GNAT family N-acetyltransferase [Shewanella sp. AS16]
MTEINLHACLSGERVVLEPLTLEHTAALSLAARDGALWELWYTSVPHPDEVAAYIQEAMKSESLGESLAFAVRDKLSGLVVGSTRICSWDQANRRLELGYTWYGKSAQRSGINTETKLLLLGYAFETLGVIAVEFRTHWFNQASRQAIARLGAKQDGVLRNHKILKDGSLRDTVVFSILDSEWPAVKANLQFRLLQHKE